MSFPRSAQFIQVLKGLGRSKATISAYSRDLTLFFSLSDSISDSSVQGVIVSLTGRGYKASSIRRLLSSLRTYCSVLGIEMNLSSVPKPKLKIEEAFDVSDDVFSNGIINIIEDESAGKYTPEFKSMVFELLYKTGVRVSELLSLTKDSFTKETKSVLVTGKGDKQRRIPVHPSIAHIFQDDVFFSMLGMVSYNTVLYWAKKYFGDKCTPHSFRHGFTTKIIKNGANQYSVKSVLGHESYTTTLRYFHMDFNEVQKEVLAALKEDKE